MIVYVQKSIVKTIIVVSAIHEFSKVKPRISNNTINKTTIRIDNKKDFIYLFCID